MICSRASVGECISPSAGPESGNLRQASVDPPKIGHFSTTAPLDAVILRELFFHELSVGHRRVHLNRRIPVKIQTLLKLPLALAIITLVGCQSGDDSQQAAEQTAPTSAPAPAPATGPTSDDAKAFIAASEKEIRELGLKGAQAAWVQANFITEDTQAIAARANEEFTAAGVRMASEAARFNDLELDFDTRRKLDKLKLGLTLPAPNDEAKTKELSRITSGLEATYGKGKYCRSEDECWTLPEMGVMLADERDPDLLKEIWEGWREISKPMRSEYQRMVEIANEGASDLGYPDLGTMWRSKYDMEPDAFAAETDRLWEQVKPLYDALHCHVRDKLADYYGERLVPRDKPIPAHLMGNMWAQSWGNIYDLAAPAAGDPGYDLTERIEASGMSEVEMVKSAERFFTSLTFEPLPETFWERSLFTQPQDRDVVCHASAWNLDWQDDLRIKMCIQKNAEDFRTIHHELGHNFYQRAYNPLSVLYQESANDGFHEAIGDTIALSVTPSYLKQIDLIDEVPDESADLALLMRLAMDKVAFLPFGLLVDRWRWQVFNGTTAPEDYNAAWWELRTRYQGITAPVDRDEEDFDPGAKYHIPGNTPYSRYFLAHILQFQFHRTLCEIAGNTGPLHRCSIYNSAEAGTRLNEMLEMGSSRPWPEALAKLTGSPEMDATAIIDYFAPLKLWLDEQNTDRQCGW
jgi:peptidyl-dipeptidase A